METMFIPFTKMHGIGNDFVMLDNRAGELNLSPQVIQQLADRRFGVGCDQVLVAAAPESAGADVTMQIFNADGSRAGQCGNGLRCFAIYMRDKGAITRDDTHIDTPGGVVHAQILDANYVRASMGEPPQLEPAQIPLVGHTRAIDYPIDVDGERLSMGAVSMGNPHAVLTVVDVDRAPVERLGPAIQALADFPQGVNVGFMQVLARDHVRLRVFERGVGETLACGSGACAAVVVGQLQGMLDSRVRVGLRGGELDIEWGGPGHPVIMTGPTALVFESKVEL
jgi:diaminopimelate epimerase